MALVHAYMGHFMHYVSAPQLCQIWQQTPRYRPVVAGALLAARRHKDAALGDAAQQPRSCMLSDGVMWDVSLRGALAGSWCMDACLHCHLMHACTGS